MTNHSPNHGVRENREEFENVSVWVDILVIILSILGLAIVSMIETAMVSVSPVRLRQLEEQGHRTAPLVQRLVDRRQHLLLGQVVAVNIFVLLAANTTTVLARRWGAGAVLWANLLVLVLMLIFGEVIPKTLSVQFAEQVALRTAWLATALDWLLSPVAFLLSAIATVLLRLLIALHILPGSVHPAPTAYSEEDIKDLVTAGEQSGEVEPAERDMIHGVIEFAETSAHEIMVPRTDLVALPIDSTLEEAVHTFMETGHSRLPVYRENADDILGVLYIKDLLIRLKYAEDAGGPPPTIGEMLRPAYFVPESKKSDELLREMQRRRVHMAIVVDEYGGTAGIITIEDLLEEIVGDIIDEYDIVRQEVVMLPDGTALVNGMASLDTIAESLDIPIPETEAETLSGLVTEILGHIPEIGDQVVVHHIRFTVIEVAHNRAERLKAVALPPGEAQQHED